MQFSKARGREKIQNWVWKNKEIERVRKLRYLGQIFHKNENHSK